MKRVPKVSIIIVNYNGLLFLGECLHSVLAIDYPADSREVIVVDNNSSDDSVSFIKATFPQIKLVRSEENVGFSGGNILGLQAASGEYIVLLNSDTKVDECWLRELVRAAEPENVGAVNSKLYFWMPFLELTISSSILERGEITGNTDFSPLGVLLENVLCADTSLSPLIWYGSGFYEKIQGEITLRWTRDKATILLPFREGVGNNIYKLTAHGYPVDKPVTADLTLSLGSEVIVNDKILSHQVKEYMLNVDPQMVKQHGVWLVQNAGNIILQDGNGKDRGSVVLKRKGESIEFYERDNQLFKQPTKLLAFCGASCLLKRKVLDQVGFLDENYFMYYEDLDLSLRIWSAGWDIVYAPDSIVYHRHRATAKSGPSDGMLYHLEKNYLAFLFTYFPLRMVTVQSLRAIARLVMTFARMKLYELSDNLIVYESWRSRYQKRHQALKFILRQSGSLWRKRLLIAKRAKRRLNKEGKAFQY